MKVAVLFAVAFVCSVIGRITTFPAVQDDKIIKLPGLTQTLNFNQYAGYINVDAHNGRNLFYWFVESQRSPSQDKLVLWLNGGPGCSSIGGGLMTELGPFRVNSDGESLSLNPNSWNTIANVIFLESPAGVGFSYSNTSSDYNVGDKRTADDSVKFLLGFFAEYPAYKNRPFWIAGESYGGHYVPELANRILEGNQNGEFNINLQGFMAGNPWTYMPIDNFGAIFYWWTHALISDDTYNNIIQTCDFTDIGPERKNKRSDPQACNNYLGAASEEMGNVNIYDIYVDVCTSDQDRVIKPLADAGSPLHKMLYNNMKNKKRDDNTINPPYQPCADEYTTNYLNLPDVKHAIHVSPHIDYQWSTCSGLVNYNYSDVEKSVIPLYQKFVQDKKIQVLVYSGDVDAIVPYTGTRAWVNSLNLTVVESWRPYTVNGQVGGYVTIFDGLTFATVRDAGHMVPQTQPARALAMFSAFLQGTPFPPQ